MNEDRFFKTVRGEVYVKCGITFGPDPVHVSGKLLSQVSRRAGLDRTIGDWLTSDKRLIEVPSPSKKAEPGNSAEPEKADNEVGTKSSK
ncbi:MAG: hypothetical protein IT537_05035 [Hyphomicrobiales bacterium]|nr:hypothetical protein [Hyphomicrobiales bacterium]